MKFIWEEKDIQGITDTPTLAKNLDGFVFVLANKLISVTTGAVSLEGTGVSPIVAHLNSRGYVPCLSPLSAEQVFDNSLSSMCTPPTDWSEVSCLEQE